MIVISLYESIDPLLSIDHHHTYSLILLTILPLLQFCSKAFGDYAANSEVVDILLTYHYYHYYHYYPHKSLLLLMIVFSSQLHVFLEFRLKISNTSPGYSAIMYSCGLCSLLSYYLLFTTYVTVTAPSQRLLTQHHFSSSSRHSERVIKQER